MNLNIYTIKDAKAGTHAQPFFSVNHTTAIRSFHVSVKDSSNPLSAYPEDFSLWHLGTYNDITGKLVGNDPEFVANSVQTIEEGDNE